jgi:hypothetical protein
MPNDSSNIKVLITADGTEAYSVKMQDAAKASQKFGVITGGTSKALHAQVDDLQATSASLRLFEGHRGKLSTRLCQCVDPVINYGRCCS